MRSTCNVPARRTRTTGGIATSIGDTVRERVSRADAERTTDAASAAAAFALARGTFVRNRH